VELRPQILTWHHMLSSPETTYRLAPLTQREKARLAIEIVAIYVPTRLRLRHSNFKLMDEIQLVSFKRVIELPSEQITAVAIHLGAAVARTLGRLPADSSCLVRSLVLMRLLSRRGFVACLVIGIRHNDKALAAHAWVEYGGTPLLASGGDDFARLLQLETPRATRHTQ
jgi:Transglutaminase-like superfamily